MVSALASGARGPRFDPCPLQGKFWSPNTLSQVSFVGMILDKCIVLLIWMSPVQGKSPLVQISILLLVGFHPATRSVQCTPARGQKYFNIALALQDE